MSEIWVDGSGWNGKRSRLAVVFDDGKKIVRETKQSKTNNVMEYEALLLALSKANKGDTIYTDSKLVQCQVQGLWKITKEHLRPLCESAKTLVDKKNIKLVWVPRGKNKAGILLESLQRHDIK